MLMRPARSESIDYSRRQIGAVRAPRPPRFHDETAQPRKKGTYVAVREPTAAGYRAMPASIDRVDNEQSSKPIEDPFAHIEAQSCQIDELPE